MNSGIQNGIRFTIAVLIGLTMTMNLSAQKIDVWIGTGGPDGIFHSQLDTKTGKLSNPVSAAKIAGAGFLAMHPNGKVLYSTAKQGKENGIAAFSIRDQSESDKPKNSGLLELTSFAESGDGGAACVGVDQTGKVAMSAQYGGGSTSTYRLKDDGSIDSLVAALEHGKGSGVNAKRQAKPHPHWVGTSPDNKFLFVPDLGMDAVVVYQLDAATGVATKHSKVATPPGSGPRHMKFHTSGKYVYVLNELDLTISVFGYEASNAKFTELQVIEALPQAEMDKHLNTAAEIRVHPTGKFVYSSNRGHDSISVFSVDESTGKLTFVEREHIRGAWPRNFNIDPSGKWLLAAGRHTNTLTVFEIDESTGQLTYNRQSVNVPAPICILFENE